jgi:hypothetical protein
MVLAALLLAGVGTGQILVVAVEGVPPPIDLAVFGIDRPDPVPAAIVAGRADVAPGRYRIGSTTGGGRGPVFDVGDGATSVALAAIAIAAPEGSIGRWAVFDAEGDLWGELGVNGALHVVPGAYTLRRDLGAGVVHLTASPGALAVVQMGALALAPSWTGHPVLVAAARSTEIVAAEPDAVRPLALPPGEYVVAAASDVPGVPVRVSANATTVVSLSLLRLQRDAAAEGMLLLVADDGRLVYAWRGERERVVPVLSVDGGLTVLDTSGVRARLVPVIDGDRHLWWLADGTVPAADGIPIDLDPAGHAAIVPGLAVGIVVSAAAPVRARFWLDVDGHAAVMLGEVDLVRGTSVVHVDAPAHLPEGSIAAVRAELLLGDGTSLSGVTPPYPIHRPIAHGVVGLSVRVVTTTTISLAWSPPPDAAPIGYHVFRGDGDMPLNGRRPVAADEFDDIGLSAGRAYRYRVCPIDGLGLIGPCVAVDARTPSP